MELHSPVNSVVAKRLWKVVRIACLMMRKGLISKRRLMLDMNLMIKRCKIIGKSMSHLISHHQHHSRHVTRCSFGIQEYEFSCSDSPTPVFFNVPRKLKRKYYFPCIDPLEVKEYDNDSNEIQQENKAVVTLLPKTTENIFNFQVHDSGFKPNSPLLSPFYTRAYDYSSEEDEDDNGNRRIDYEAEEFIKRFYEQLRVQNRTQLLQYQEMQYQEMLARGV